jgi:hypothetical protein
MWGIIVFHCLKCIDADTSQKQCQKGLAAGGGQVCIGFEMLSRGKNGLALPVAAGFCRPAQKKCGSEPARDGVVPDNNDVD